MSLIERARHVIPGGVHSPVRSFKGLERDPVFFESAQGSRLKCVDGGEYMDFCQSFGPLILGHRPPEVSEAVAEIMGKAWTLGACERYSLELAEWICERIPHVDKVRFVSSGTEAVMTALRVARAATGRPYVVKFNGCYHGHLDAMLVKAGSGLAGETASDSAGVNDDAVKNTLIVSLDDEKALEQVFEKYGTQIAAVVVEPLPANFGLLVQRNEFLQKIKSLCVQHQSLLLFDEVISGFRVGLSGMAERLDITPDIVTYGKIIGGGFPVGCVGGRADLMDQLAPLGPVYQAGTLSANPVGMVAGLTTLKILERDRVWETLENRTEKLLALNSDLAPHGFRITVYSSLFWIHAIDGDAPVRQVEQIPAVQKEKFKKIFLQLLERGVYLSPNAYEVGFVGLAHEESDLDLFMDRVREVVS